MLTASASPLSRAGEHVDLTNRFAAATFTRFARSTAEVGAGRAWEIGRPDVRNRTVTFPSSLYDRPKRLLRKVWPMSIANNFDRSPDAGFTRSFDAESARRQFQLSL